MARTESDETGALGTTGSGGKLPGYIAPDDTQYVPEFVQAIHADNPTDGQVLAPFRSSFGWHVVQVMYHPPDQAQMEKLKTEADGGGTSRSSRADFSESQTSGAGGDLGWIATRPARPAADRRDLRGTDRQDERDRQRDRRRAVPLQGGRGAGADPRGPPARRPPPERVQRLVRRQEGAGRRSIGARGASRAVLDALVAEAGCAGARPCRRPPGRRGGAPHRDAASRHPGRSSSCRWRRSARRTTERAVEPLPGRQDPPAVTRSRCSAGSTRPTTRSAASASADRTTIGELTPATSRRRSTWARSLRSSPSAGRGRCPGSRTACAAPDGCPWDREQTHASLRKHLLEETYEVYDALDAGATPEPRRGARRPAAAGRAPRAARRGGRRLRPCRRAGGDRGQDRAPPSARVRRRGGADGNGREPPVGADQGRRARRGSRGGRRRGPGAPRARSTGSARRCPRSASSQEMQERAANLGYDWPSIVGVLDKVTEELEELRAAGTDARVGRGVRRPPVRARQRRPHATASNPKPRSARPTTSSGGGSAASSARPPTQGVALRDLDFDALDDLWHVAKAEEREPAP